MSIVGTSRPEPDASSTLGDDIQTTLERLSECGASSDEASACERPWSSSDDDDNDHDHLGTAG